MGTYTLITMKKLDQSKQMLRKKLNAVEDSITRHKVSLATLEARFADCAAAVERFIAEIQGKESP